MGSSFSCVGGGARGKGDAQPGTPVSLSPAVSLRRRSSAEPPARGGPSLLSAAVLCVARGLASGRVQAAAVAALPTELLQLVCDQLADEELLTLPLLQQLVSPWLFQLQLAGLPGVDDEWVPVLAGARHLARLDLSGSQLSDSGAAWLSWLWELRELRLQHVVSISDAGLSHLSRLTALRVLDLEGCDGISGSSLVAVGQLVELTSLNLGQCPEIRGNKLSHLAGLRQLRELSLGWCRSLGDTRSDAGNTIRPLAALHTLTRLNLGGTRVCDEQAAEVLPALTQLQALDLSRTAMTAAGLPALQALAGSLRVLKLRGCPVHESGGASLARLTRLESLDLANSGFGNAGLLALQPLGRLTELSLDMCHVGDEGCRAFLHLTALAVCDLSDTDVGDAGVSCLSRCRDLAWLSLCNTEIGDVATSSLTGLSRLTHLNLDTRGVSDACLPLLLPLGGVLRELDLSGGRITSRGAALLAAGYSALTKLELCGGHVTDRACLELSKLGRLAHLNVSQNRCLGDAGLRALAVGLASLESLNLSYTGVTDACLASLASMQALRVVVLSYACVSEAGAARLRAVRPQLLVKATRKKSNCL